MTTPYKYIYIYILNIFFDVVIDSIEYSVFRIDLLIDIDSPSFT